MKEKFIVNCIAYSILASLCLFAIAYFSSEKVTVFYFTVAFIMVVIYSFFLSLSEQAKENAAARKIAEEEAENKRIADAKEADRLAKLKDLEDTEYAKNRGRVRAEVEHLEETMRIYIDNKKRGMDMEAEFLELTRQRDFENMKNQSKLLSDYVNEFKSI